MFYPGRTLCKIIYRDYLWKEIFLQPAEQNIEYPLKIENLITSKIR